MTDTSDCESDAGASPSVSSDESSSSSGSSSVPTVKVDVVVPSSTSSACSRRRSGNNSITSGGGGTSSSAVTTPNNTNTRLSSSGLLTPVSSGRKPAVGRRRLCPPAGSGETSNSSVSIISSKAGLSGPTCGKPRRGSQSYINNKPSTSSVSISVPSRKRKPLNQTLTSADDHAEEDPKRVLERKTKRNKRRRTRSERNMLAGKSIISSPSVGATQVVTEGEEAVALDAEIDRVLEEKANKNNLSATNVKSIIHHVITNNMVQRMIMSAMKKRAENADAGGSSDDDLLVGPKMTRAKTKELLENKQISLWPNVYSPMKAQKKPVSETHMLIQQDLPEDSSGDEEYVPQETDISGMIHSDEESSSVASHTSDIGSPSPVVTKQRVAKRRCLQICETPPISDNDNIFKTPPPRPGLKKTQEESGISRRTRSKLPLKDTAIEDLERQFVPPDVTLDMYDWGETDNEDWKNFLKDFINPCQNQNDQDDEADPEYNVMEDIEDEDREELRRDRAVKVPKKELTQLIAELFEPGMLSGDELEDHDLSTLTGITPLVSDACPMEGDGLDSSFQQSKNCSTVDASELNLISCPPSVTISIPEDNSKANNGNDMIYAVQQVSSQDQSGSSSFVRQSVANPAAEISNSTVAKNISTPVATINLSESQQPGTSTNTAVASTNTNPIENIEGDYSTHFRDEDLKRLQHQMQQHIQLLTQTYVLTVLKDDNSLKNIARTAKMLVIELKNRARLCTKTVSNYAVCNLDSAWNIVNFWPHKFFQQSPIKKKILEERCITESVVTEGEGEHGKGLFPRHVVKVIVENPAFLYNNLLPECYNQSNFELRNKYIFHEDALLVEALDELKGMKKSTTQLASIISEILLVVRSESQVYHRIRNLRKVSGSQYCDPAIKKYFTEGVLPPVDRTVPEVTDAPLIQRSRDGLSPQWLCLLQHFEESPTFKWEEKLSNDPVSKSLTQKWNKFKIRNKLKATNTDEVESTRPQQNENIFQVFPNGTYQIENTNPNVQAIPLLNANGKPGAIIYVPRYALPPVSVPSPVHLSTPRQTDVLAEPRQASEAQEIGKHVQQENVHGASSSSGLNMIGLHHLIRRSQRTPLKNTPIHSNSSDSPKPPPTTITHLRIQNSQIRVGAGYHIVQPVGKPFNLSELGVSPLALKNGSDQVIDLASLQTPIKNKIFEKAVEKEKVTEETDKKVEISAVMTDEESCNSNVIEEGTEAELTSDEDEEIDEGPREPPEVITLDSDEDIPRQNGQCPRDLKVTPVESEGNEKNDNKSTNEESKNANSSSGNTQENGTGNTSASSTTSTLNATTASSTLFRPGKADDSDEEKDKKGSRKRSLPKECEKEDSKDTRKENLENNSGRDKLNKRPSVIVNVPSSSPGNLQNQTQSKPSAPSSSQQTCSSNNKPPLSKKAKRSPGNPQTSRRSSKYNVAPAEKLVEDDPNEFEHVADAYMATYLAKVQSTTEKNNPGLYTSFLQILMDVGDGPIIQNELHSKVKILFKDYPDLLREFESFLDPTMDGENDTSNVKSSSHEEIVAEMDFLQKIERFTEQCPQLKGKVLNKIKSLREKSNLTEKDVANTLEHFFTGNPVMMEAFKSLLPGVYRPHSTSTGMDFEEIELDMEDPIRENGEDMHFEVVKLPDETTVPATTTCPCVCHTKTSDLAFSNRSKHCRKCSVKFQDGKIFIHNGRVMRPVSVELTPAPTTSKAGLINSTPFTSAASSSKPCGNVTVHHEPRVRKDSHSTAQKSTEFKEPELCNKSSDKKPPSVSTNSRHIEIHSVNASHKSYSQSKEAVKKIEIEESKPRLQLVLPPEETPTTKGFPNVEDNIKPQSQRRNQAPGITLNGEKHDDMDDDWTEEEDTLLLTVCQQAPSLKIACEQVAVQIPHRSTEQIESRCNELIQLIQSATDDE